VVREGGVDRQIRVISIPPRFRRRALRQRRSTSSFAPSTSTRRAAGRRIAGSEQSVRVLGNAERAAQLAATQITLPGGRFVPLGRHRRSARRLRRAAYGRHHGRPSRWSASTSAGAKGASVVEAYEATWKELRKIEEEDPRVRFVEISNEVDYTKNQYSSSMIALVEGAVLAVLVVFLFLRDMRATLISAVAIPLSAIPAFWFMD
jgi:multidrug efflux pump subunit AcrB